MAGYNVRLFFSSYDLIGASIH